MTPISEKHRGRKPPAQLEQGSADVIRCHICPCWLPYQAVSLWKWCQSSCFPGAKASWKDQSYFANAPPNFCTESQLALIDNLGSRSILEPVIMFRPNGLGWFGSSKGHSASSPGLSTPRPLWTETRRLVYPPNETRLGESGKGGWEGTPQMLVMGISLHFDQTLFASGW